MEIGQQVKTGGASGLDENNALSEESILRCERKGTREKSSKTQQGDKKEESTWPRCNATVVSPVGSGDEKDSKIIV